MKLLNLIVKYTGYFGITITTLISSYLIAVTGTSFLMSLVCAVWSFIKPLPPYLVEHYGTLLLQCSIPSGICVGIYVMINAIKKK